MSRGREYEYWRPGQWARYSDPAGIYQHSMIGEVIRKRRGLVHVLFLGRSTPFGCHWTNLTPLTRREKALALASKVLEVEL